MKITGLEATRGVVYVGTSVDGFIARPGGQVDFLDPVAPMKGDLGFQTFLASIDVIVMGRNTFDFVMSMDLSWPYGELPVYVVTARPLEVPEGLADVIRATSKSPTDLIGDLTAAGHRRAYIDGGHTVQSYLRAGLISEITVTQAPVLIGSGIRLFGDVTADVRLRHIETLTDDGYVQTKYEVIG